MDGVDEVLQDWTSCRPDGVVLRSSQLGEVISRVVARADALTDAGARSRVYRFLAPAASGPPLLVQRLRIDGGHRLSGADGPEACVAVVHFLCFWQALDEVLKASRLAQESETGVRQVAEELAKFRDSLIDCYDSKTLTVGSLIENLVVARRDSVDQTAWGPLQAVVARTAAAAASGETEPGAVEVSGQPEGGAAPALVPPQHTARHASRDIHEEHLPLDAVAMLVLPWLQQLVEDYQRGEKFQRIQKVCEELGCEASEACISLCATKWNVETTLRRHRAAAAAATQRAEAERAAAAAAEQAAAERATAEMAAPSAPASTAPIAPSSPGGGASAADSSVGSPTASVPQPRGETEDQPQPFTETLPVLTPGMAPLASPAIAQAQPEEEQEDEEEEECTICVQPYGKGNEPLTTRCCQKVLCAHCAATLSTGNGLLRCPFCRRTERHPARPEDGPEPVFSGVLEAGRNFAEGAGRFMKELFGSAPPARDGPRPNMRLDAVYR